MNHWSALFFQIKSTKVNVKNYFQAINDCRKNSRFLSLFDYRIFIKTVEDVLIQQFGLERLELGAFKHSSLNA
jgi:hypothetical protein